MFVRAPRNNGWPILSVSLGRSQYPEIEHITRVQVSSAMGFGFRCGFLGMLHMDIVQERLEREHNLSLIMSAPTVIYRCTTTKGVTEEVRHAVLH